MSSLQQQLKKLSVPYVEHVLEAKKASLLYDSKDVASLDIGTILDLALEGLSHLIKINGSFSRYKNVLFDDTAVKFNRASRAKETNEKLDAILQQYLIEVSPYFLMRPAQHTLEWLVHRYQIQFHSIDDWLLTILSFHNSKMFVRVLSIIDLGQPTNKWHWLNNCAKHGSPLPRVVIVNHCKKDVGFLRFLLSSVKMFVGVMNPESESLNIMINFCFEICLDLIKISHEVTQEIVSILVQFLTSGIESKCLAWEERCYEYLPRLASVNLADEKIFYFCRKISKYHSESLVRSAILCLNLLVCQCDSECDKKVFKKFIITNSKLQEIVDIVKEMNIVNLLECLIDVDSSGSIQQILDQLKDTPKEEEENNTGCESVDVQPVPMEVEDIQISKPTVMPKNVLDWIALLASDDQIKRIRSIQHLEKRGRPKNEEQYSSIVKKIFRRKEEIKEDCSHLLVLFGEIFSNNDTELGGSLSSILQHIADEKTSQEFKKCLIKCFKLTRNQFVVSFFSKLAESQATAFQNEGHESCIDLLKALLDCLSGYLNNCSDYTTMIVGLLNLKDCKDNKDQSLSMLAVETIANSPASVKEEDQDKIVKALIELGLNASCSHKIQKACRKFAITADLISSVLNINSVPRDENGPKLKRMRLNNNLIDVKKTKFILETLQGSKNIDHNGMCCVLSSIVSNLASENKEDGEYCCQLALVCMHRVITSEKNVKILDVNIESLAQCLRQVSSFQTQQHILIVMTAIAPALPRELLHNIVAVFAFMGNELLERDDRHSFEILTSLVDVALKSVKQLMESMPEATTTLMEVLRIFVDSRSHIPQHRLKPLFNQLVSVDVEEYLWKVIVLFAESSVCKKSDSNSEEFKQQLAQDQDIIRSIVSCYPPETLLSLMKNLTTFLRSILLATKKGNIELLDQSILKNQHLCQCIFKYLSKIMLLLIESETMGMPEDPTCIKVLAEETLNLMQDIDDQRKVTVKENASFLSSRMDAVVNIFKKLNQFLPGKSFVELLSNVLHKESSSIKFKGLQLLQFHLCAVEKKLVVVKGSECVLTLVPQLIKLTTFSEDKENMKTDLHVKQLSFFVLKLMCRIFGSDHYGQFGGMHDILIRAINPEHVANLIITDSALLCLSEYIVVMKTRLIPSVPSITSALTSLYENEKIWKSHDAVNCLNVATNKLLLHLGHFLGDGLNDLVIDLCCLPSRAADVFEKCSAEFNNLIHVVGTKIESRILLPVLIDSYDRLVRDNVCCVEVLFNIFRINCKQMSKESLDSNLKVITEIVVKFLNVRCDASSLSTDKLSFIEDVYVESILAFLQMLSEKKFRHMFDELLRMASTASDNIITFFNLMLGFSKQLRSIFNVFSKNLVSVMTSSLKNSESLGTKSSLLLNYLLNLIGQCHLNDISGSFAVTSSKSMYQEVVNQLENFAGGKDEFLKRVEEHVIPCLVQMVQSIKDVEILQELHKTVCAKTRHGNPLVRISTIRCLTAIVESLGNAYDVLFPELAPCISELLEDDDEDVAQVSRQLQTVLEKTVGSLNNYF